MHNKVFEHAAECVEYAVDRAMAEADLKIESPLEQIFLETLLVIHMVMFRGMPPVNTPGENNRVSLEPRFGIKTQYQVGRYRADFLLVGFNGAAIIVECDGHNFHERTKEQAARDRQRDRDLQAAGFIVLRFTGSELWADPMKCGREAITVLLEAPPKLKTQAGSGYFILERWMKDGDDWIEVMNHEIEQNKLASESFMAPNRAS